MELDSHPPLEAPSFLHGAYTTVHRKAMREGQRCAKQYREKGSLPAPRELLEVPPGEVVVVDKSSDLQRERPVWRLYMLSDVREALCEALDWEDAPQLRDLYEATFRETPWGALYYAVSHIAPMDARCVALRLKAVLHFWGSLQSVRFLFNSPSIPLSLDELMVKSCDWAMEAWCPEGGESIRTCLERAADRMARATREDSIEAILRLLPRILPAARGLKHPAALADPALWRARLATLDPESFSRISAASAANLLQRLYLWDREFEGQ